MSLHFASILMQSRTLIIVGAVSLLLLCGLVGGIWQATIRNQNESVAAAQQQAQGEELYAIHCTRCHVEDGGIGPTLKPAVLADYSNAAKLNAYTRKFMPYNTDFRLADDEYWAVTAYLLTLNEFMPADNLLNDKDAEQIKLTK